MSGVIQGGRKEVFSLAWPLIIANSFWIIQITIDRVFLGQFSTDSLAAAVSATGLFWAPMALVQQTAAYVTTFIAQYFGAKRMDRIGSAVWQATYVSIIGGLGFLLLIPLTPIVFGWIGHSESIKANEIDYFQALCFSALPTALVAVASGFFTGIGRTSAIMLINGIGLVFNVLLDYLLIFGKWGFPAMGISGAGYATALASLAAAVFGYALMLKHNNSKLYALRTAFNLDIDLLRRFLKYGIPSGLQWALEGLAFTVFLIIVGNMPDGDAALAASGITVTIMMLSILPALGIAQAVSVLVGKYLGEDLPQLAAKASWSGVQISLVYILSVGLSFIAIPDFYLNWFYNEHNAELWRQVQTMVPYLLMFVAFFTIFDSLNIVFSFALKGAGDTRFVTAIALTLPWPIMVLPTWYSSQWTGAVYWAWAAASAFSLCQAGIFFARFKGEKWMSLRVIEREAAGVPAVSDNPIIHNA